jgi:4-amino-4-deoxy-L-arabinose transferase-like glycosyltransferase
MPERISLARLGLETAGAFVVALLILLTLAPDAPFTKELGVCESGAVRDILAGNFLLPHFIPGPMVHVPPLYWWSAALTVKFLGWTELSFRLPALAPAALTCGIIYAWATAQLSREAAMWGVAALLFGHFFLDAARQPRMDAMLAMFTTAAIVLFDPLLKTRQWRWAVAAAIAIGLGCLTKGILGIALPGLAIAFYLLVRRRFLELFRSEVIGAFVAGLAIGLTWYVAGFELAGDKFLRWQIGMNLWSRFVPAEAGGANYCVHPVWYFVPEIVVGMLPWSVFLPALALLLWPRRKRLLPEPISYALCWFVAILLFFSLSRGKCLIYILPVFPPLAVLLGWTIAKAREEASDITWFRRLFAAGSILAALGAVLLISGAIAILINGLPAHLPLKLHPTDRRFLEIFGAIAAAHDYRLLSWMIVSAVGALAILLGAFRGELSLGAFGVLLIAAAGARFWFGVMNPALAERETLKTFTRDVIDVVPANSTIGHIGIEDCDLYFYSPRPITPVFRFRCDAHPSFPEYIVIRKNRLEAMPPEQRACLSTILISQPVDNNGPRLLVQLTPVKH